MELFGSAHATSDVRTPPQDLQAEQATLGSMLVERKATEIALRMVEWPDFYREAHRTICRAMQEVFERREPVDLTTVCAELRRQGALEEVGGSEYLTALIGEVPTAAHVARYAQIVADKATLRRLVTAGIEIADTAYGNPADAQATALWAEERVKEVSADNLHIGGFRHIGDDEDAPADLDAYIERAGDPELVPHFGIGRWDRLMGGMPHPGLVSLGGESSSGKTTLSLEAAVHMAGRQHSEPCGIVSVEMSREQVRRRLIEILGDLDLSARGLTSEGSREQMRQTAHNMLEELMSSRALFITAGSFSIEQIESQVRGLKSEYPELRLVVVDYFQQIRDAADDWRFGNERERLARRADRLAAMAKELVITVLTPSQITWLEGGEVRMRGGEDLENASDCQLRIDRPGKTREQRRASTTAKLVMRKHRLGPSGGMVEVGISTAGAFVELDDQGRQAPPPRRDARDGF